jgi:hypothetical protein
MRADTMSKALSMIERCAAIDWRQPVHDPVRVAAAYQRWMAIFGLERRVRWVADPADIEAWQMQGAGVAQVWAMMAASNPAGSSTIGLLLNSSLGPAIARRRAPPLAAADIAAAWAFAITSHMMVAEAAWNTWGAAWIEVTARQPAIFIATALLCPGVPWAPPPMIACAARDALSACADEAVWPALADVLARPERLTDVHAWIRANPPTPEEIVDALIAVSEPMVEACEAGAFAHTLLDQEIVVLASPSLWTDGRRLHRAEGPALAWPRTRLYAWKGVLVPEELMIAPQIMTPDMIRAVPDQVLQHTLIDMYAHTHGHRRCVQDVGGIMMHEDHTGRLWLLNPGRPRLPPQPGDLKIVEVTNGTPEPDGSRKTYWLTVPPEMQTAQQAVAWTYGLAPQDYEGLVVRT